MGEIAGGRIPMITWGATSTASINSGNEDAFIKAQATRLKNLNARSSYAIFTSLRATTARA